MKAVEAFISKSTVPLLLERCDKLILQGTGTLFRMGDRHFIVTARHLLDAPRAELEVFIIPDSQVGPNFTRIQKVRYSAPDSEHVDIGAFEILDEVSINAIKKNWNFLTLDNVRIDGFGAPLWVHGYPSKSADFTAIPFRIPSVALLTDLLDAVPERAAQPVLPGLDFFVGYAKSAFAFDIRKKADVPAPDDTPPLHGVSGASVWYVDEPPGESLWAAARVTKAVAIQVSFLHSSFVRIQSWVGVAVVLSIIDDQLREEVEAKLGLQIELELNPEGKRVVKSVKRVPSS